MVRLLRGEPVDAVSSEVSVPIYKLECWRDRALVGIDAGLNERENDPVDKQLDDANRRIGELPQACARKGRSSHRQPERRMDDGQQLHPERSGVDPALTQPK